MKGHTKIFLFTILDMKIKDSKYVKINSVNPLYINFNKVSRYFEEINKSKYLTLVHNNNRKKKKKKLKKYEKTVE